MDIFTATKQLRKYFFVEGYEIAFHDYSST